MSVIIMILIAIAIMALIVADALAFDIVRERWLFLQQRKAAQLFQPVTDWMWSKQRDTARLPFGALWCYYFRAGEST